MPANNVKFVVGTVNIGCFRDATLSLWFVKLPEVATESVNRVARWLSQNYRTLTVSMLVAQNIELFTLALSGITFILTPDKGPKYRPVRLNTRHLATLNMKYINRPPYLTTRNPPLAPDNYNDINYRPMQLKFVKKTMQITATL